MINKRLLHFLSFVYFKRRSAWEKMNHALIVVERQQMLRHFYSMITPLLTLHTATTATLLVVSLTLNNTKKKQSLQSILQQSQQTNLPKLDLESRYRIVSQLSSYIVKLLIVDEYQNSGEQQSEEALKFQTTVFLQLMCYWQSNLLFSALRGCLVPSRLCLNLVYRLLHSLVLREPTEPRGAFFGFVLSYYWSPSVQCLMCPKSHQCCAIFGSTASLEILNEIQADAGGASEAFFSLSYNSDDIGLKYSRSEGIWACLL